ncbi:hypothetical protein LTR84_006809 [Exophiala bonariae]|uniref:RWD domain-containing protein n=1 Tax=Exophiala bonariae TaxID=1690606 RepID=A0AAV9N0A6_9EURO|nr:hypothetical protein LTR84_006809 [Exophiala bonariae]
MASTEEDVASRLDAELSLLDAMYPSSVTWMCQSREVRFKTSTSASSGELQLRLPDTYPGSGLPSVISACDGTRNDVRERMRCAMRELGLVEGEECLDRVVGAFEGVVRVRVPLIRWSFLYFYEHGLRTPTGSETGIDSTTSGTNMQLETQDPPSSSKTVIIWLHHLLATSKRKLAINPTLHGSANPSLSLSTSTPNTHQSISGITKPGYPGILIFSGASRLVDAHVRELKDLNWQAFQVRYDSTDDGADRRCRWGFVHEESENGRGRIVEVETMAEVVKGIVGERERGVFLRCVGVK